ncbi:MAG: HNH endonuclease [Bacteroidales bacterium]|nr:HNH endonuclease [Bacteroidales bacterium]
MDKSLKYPDPMSACVDHIIPISRGGHPSDLSNLQLAHWTCNRMKSDKLFRENKEKLIDLDELVSNRNLPLSMNWKEYKAQ